MDSRQTEPTDTTIIVIEKKANTWAHLVENQVIGVDKF